MPNESCRTTVRCRKCRRVLLTRNVKTDNDDECCKTFAQLQPILDDDGDDGPLPDWLTSALNQSEWRKGKLRCPGCDGKIGSLNFITPQMCSCGRRRAPLAYLYKSRIDVCTSANSIPLRSGMEGLQPRDHFAVLKKSTREDGEWMIVFDSKPVDFTRSIPSTPASKMTDFKTHRKSRSWHASSSSVSNWLTSTLSDVSSHMDAAATETKQALVGTLDLASSVVVAPVSSAIRKSHRKTKSWSGSIKTTLSSLLGGIFSNARDQSNIAATSSTSQPLPVAEELDSDNNTVLEREMEAIEREAETGAALVFRPALTPALPGRGKKKSLRTPRERGGVSKPIRPRSRSSSPVLIIPDYLLCSICLDIFCLPRYCLPCRHAFCEPCLKLLAHSLQVPRNCLRTLCPLCRQIIRWTEPAVDLHVALRGPQFAKRYSRRVSEYRVQPSLLTLKLPGIYRLKFIRQIVGRLPERLARYLETFWVDYTPLVTLYSFCVSLLCLLFFFTLFLPCVYLTSWICKILENFSSFNELGVWVIYEEILNFGALIISHGVLSLASVIVMISIALYTVFVM